MNISLGPAKLIPALMATSWTLNESLVGLCKRKGRGDGEEEEDKMLSAEFDKIVLRSELQMKK